MKQIDAKRLVIVDECGSNIALTPLYGWALKGQRCHGNVPPESSGRIPPGFLPCLSTSIGACMILEGSVNTLAFETYVEQLLAPNLVAGQIVVLDNLSAHTGARVRQRERGTRL